MQHRPFNVIGTANFEKAAVPNGTAGRPVPPASNPDLGYILSVSYSGSTLLAMLLGSHPEACTVGEMRAPTVDSPDSYLCSCGEQIKACGFWAAVSESMARRGFPGFDITDAKLSIHESRNRYVRRLLDPLPRGPLLELARTVGLTLSTAWRPHLSEIQRRNAALVDVLREATGAKVVIDSSKISLHLRYLLKSRNLKIKVIFLIRDGRAVTMSMVGHGLKRATRQETIAAAALSWRRNNEAAERVLAKLPSDQWLQIRYEDFCVAPQEKLTQIASFLSVDPQAVVMDFRLKRQHVLGNDMRLKSDSRIRLDERWRTGLSKEDIVSFNHVAGEMNRKYGYE
jgi:hypothetical protein